jgi:hypothetical protein
MNRHHYIPAVTAILCFATSNIFAHGPAGAGPSAAPHAAPAASMATWNSMAMQRAAFHTALQPSRASTGVARQLAAVNPALTSLAAQIRGANPRLSPQQSMLIAGQQISQYAAQLSTLAAQNAGLAGPLTGSQSNFQNSAAAYQNAVTNAGYLAQGGAIAPTTTSLGQATEPARLDSAIAGQLIEANASQSALAAQIRGTDPRLSPQQANQLAADQINQFAQREGMNAASSLYSGNAGQTGFAPGYYPPYPWWDYGYGGYGGFFPDYGATGYDAGFYGPVAAAGYYGFGSPGVASALGQDNQPAAPAPLTQAQVQGNALRNQSQGAQTARNIADRASRPTTEELNEWAHAANPRPLAANEIDPVSGTLYWPSALQDDSFEPLRQVVQDYAAKWAQSGSLDRTDQMGMRKQIVAMYDSLKSQIHDIAPQDYVACRGFLERLLFATTQRSI